MTALRLPSATDQLAFLENIQRLFDEGEFVATYKFALLLGITELAVERGNESADELDLPYDAIAEKFLELYWQQAAPYSGGGVCGVLIQSSGKQSAIITMLQELRTKHGTLSKARGSSEWNSAIRSTVRLLIQMPLWRLQTLRRQPVEFLYLRAPDKPAVRLRPGVMYNLRRFQGLLQHLARSAWLSHIRSNPQNVSIIGQASDLETALFGTNRVSLAAVQSVLRDMQKDMCFYCKKPLQSKGEVDHFIPWSRYPRDLGHNFVLAHKICNNDKRDLLAAPIHLANWRQRNADHTLALSERLGNYFVCDEPTVVRVAQWAYGQAYATNAQSWVATKSVTPLTSEFRTILA